MAESIGEIGLDLVVNQGQFQKQMQGITGLAKKAGIALAGAFAVKKLVDFGKSCIDLGSDLAEVQNVVDVTFPRMSAQVDEFAKKAAASFGLSETMAKKFTGTFGAMAKAFGFSEQAAYEMSSTLTGLAGDVASFYNISQDEAYTKLKSVFTGETETLKDLGIVMTQNALDAYAMANGYNKVTKDMSEAEKVALRYAFVQQQLSLATGDFARTSGSWANQVRLLSLQFDSLKATIGQGLINLFTPIIKVINTLLGKLATLANAFKAFTELITGNQGSSSSNSGMQKMAAETEGVRDNLGSATGAANGLKKATDGAGKAAKKAAKEMKQLSGIDKLNNMTTNDSNKDSGGKGSGGSGGGGAVSGSPVDYGKLADGDNVLDKQANKLQALIDRLKELGALFQKGFKIGLGDTSVLDDIQKSLKNIKKNLFEIFTDPKVVKAANKFLDSLFLNMGKVSGSFTSIGLTIADNIIGGLDKYLEQNKERIKKHLISLFDIGSQTLDIVGNFSVVLADITTVFRSDTAKQITADIIAIFANATMGVVEVGAKLARDFLKSLTEPINQNKDKIKESLNGFFDGIEPITKAFSDLVTNSFQKLNEAYDKYIEPAWEKISSGLSTIVSMALDAFQKYLLPVIKRIGKEFKALAEEHIQPLVDSFLEFAGKAIEAIAELWDFISPFVGWFAQGFIAKIATKLDFLWNIIKAKIAIITDLLKGLFDVLSGLIDFIVGVFTGDWERAWNGVQAIFQAIWDTIKSVVGDALTFIKDIITSGFNAVKSTIELVWNGISNFFSTIWEQIKFIFEPVGEFFISVFQTAMDGIKTVFGEIGTWFGEKYQQIINVFVGIGDWFKDKFDTAYQNIITAFQNIGQWATEKWQAITNVFQDVKNWFGQRFKDAYTSLTNAFSAIGTWASGKWQAVTNVFKGVGNWFGTQFKTAYSNLTKAFSKTGTFFKGVWSNIKGAFGNIADWFRGNFSKAWEAVKKVFSSGGKVFSGIKDGILNGLKSVINALISGINKIIKVPFDGINSALNKIKGIDIMGAHPFGGLPTIKTPQIPRLAQGGFVKKNTPQLAMIGDNRHQGEVVAPENKLQDLLDKAVNQSNKTDISILVPMMREMIDLLRLIYGKEYMASVTSNEVYKAWETEKRKIEKRTGKSR